MESAVKVKVAPIRTEADYLNALVLLEKFRGSAIDSKAGAKVDLLTDLIDAYSRKQNSELQLSPVDAIRFAMEQRGMRPVDLGPILGSTPRAYEVLSGKRGLSLRMIRALHKQLNIPLETLVGA
jgi:HTH-type transcriptional regulator/antitoxin HigA